jgi:hypothetical protein
MVGRSRRLQTSSSTGKRMDDSSKGFMDLSARRLFKIYATTQC